MIKIVKRSGTVGRSEGGADLRSAEEAVVEANVSRGGLESDGSAVGNVRRRELMGRRSLRRRRGKVDALAGGVVGRELVLGGNEGEKALLEARGADAIAVLVRVDLALHPEATIITGVAQLLHRGRPRPPHLSAPAPAQFPCIHCMGAAFAESCLAPVGEY